MASGHDMAMELWANNEPARAQLLTASRPEEAEALVKSLNRISQVLAPAALDAGLLARRQYAPLGIEPLRKGERR